ncbi:hypothetical protein RFI_07848 [Reticulomyxa filosa]|uniref:Eukaryotic translation initiation factor 4E n=1 Tax=Reticulomyxa filosa TaxID=46433 RepID=X6NTF6_RETFI|nr:hypothetical protein RFI_07848 [Reticulomyxa filosa]|eukprot:ETO29276.1 hypothetical protein RFI_07848 [Reticulomyxa filosa]
MSQDTLDPNDELPLQFRWTLWYSAPKEAEADQKKWDTERVKKVVEFGSVSEFWRVLNNLRAPSKLPEGADLQIFRSGVLPQWEDAFNQKGGSWKVIFHKEDNQSKFDSTWFNTILTMAGDGFDDADDICGIVASNRNSNNRLRLWTRHADDRDAVKRIGTQLKQLNKLKQKISYRVNNPM